jgi:hypothetical protein
VFNDYSSSIARGIIPAVVALTFAVCRRYIPARAKNTDSFSDIDASGRSPYIGVLIGVSFVVVVTVSFFALNGLNHLLANLDGSAEFTVLPGDYLWFFFPLFGGITMAWEVVLRLWAIFGDRKAAEAYRRWSDEKTGFRATSLLRWMIVGLALPIGVANALAIPMRASFMPTEMIVGRYAHVRPEHHPYSTVDRFEVIDGFLDRDGNFQSRPTVLLKFDDGSEWRSWTLTEDRVLDPKLVDVLSKKLNREPELIHAE